MAKKILVSYDFAQNELQNAKIQNLAAAPSSPVAGQVWYNTTSGKLEYRGDGATVEPTARASHTGTQTASTISDFAATVQSTRLDQFAAPTAALSVNGQRVTGLADPVSAQDAATKGYVDAAVNGTDWKQSVRAATTGDIVLSGLHTVDGITLAVGDRVLVKEQASMEDNGLYVVASGAWTRTSDADSNAKVTAGLSVMVEEGLTQADTQWRMIVDGAIEVGNTGLQFAQIGAGTTYSAGNGITITGNVVAVDTLIPRQFRFMVPSSVNAVINHSLNNRDVIVQVYEWSTGEAVECDVIRNSSSQITLGFAVAPAENSLRVVIQG
jgi:hypothetical protein